MTSGVLASVLPVIVIEFLEEIDSSSGEVTVRVMALFGVEVGVGF